MSNPTHRLKKTGEAVFPEGYRANQIEPLDPGFWEKVDREFKLSEVRNLRNRLIAESDAMMLPDRGLSNRARQAWIEYRQALRDITSGDLDNPTWPEAPKPA